MRHLPKLYLRRKTSAVASIRSAAKAASSDPDKVRTFANIWRSFTDPRHDSRTDAQSIEVPVLVVWGTRDPILPWFIDGRRARALLRQSHVVKLPCGHQAFAEMPERFMDTLSEFLEWGEPARNE